jgi:hypothetical protein
MALSQFVWKTHHAVANLSGDGCVNIYDMTHLKLAGACRSGDEHLFVSSSLQIGPLKPH